MESVNVEHLASKLRALGVVLSLDGDRVRCRTSDGRRPSLEAQGLLEEVRSLGVVAVDFLKHEGARASAAKDQEVNGKPLDKPDVENQKPAASEIVLPQPDADGIVRLVGVPPEVAFAAGALIKAGKAELVGRVLIHQRTVTFDLAYRMVGA